MARQVYLRRALTMAGWTAALLLFFWLFGPVLLPFLVGYGVARAAAPAIQTLQKKMKLPRCLAAALCVSAIYLFLVGVIWIVGLLLYDQICGFASALPALASSLTLPAARLRQKLLSVALCFPDGIGRALTASIEEFFQSGAGLPARLYQWIFDFVKKLVSMLPSFGLFLVTAVLSSFMLAAQLEELQTFWKQKAPRHWQQRLVSVGSWIKTTIGSWFQTQLRLMAINSVALTGGLLLLRVDYALLFGLLIAVVDSLPVFGSGTILIPWALLQFVRGDVVQALGLLGLYAAVTLLRTTLEPRLLGRQMGLNPLLTLLSMYTGFHFFGVIGMIFAPMVVMLGKQFWEHAEKQFDNSKGTPHNKGTSNGRSDS